MSSSGPSASSEQTERNTLIDRWQFIAIITAAIFLNSLQMGLQTGITGPTADSVWTVCSHIFTAIFVCEMFLKLVILRAPYFKDAWNVFDFLLAWMGVLDQWILPLVYGKNNSVLKSFQLLRLARLAKLLRMRRELLALINGLLGSLKSMMWIGILLVVVLYSFGIFCVEIVGSHDYSSTTLDTSLHFGTLPRAMLTLFNLGVLGDGWSTVIFPVWEVQPYLAPLFILYLVLTSWFLLNIIIAVIVEQTTLATQRMDAESAEQERERKMSMVDKLLKILHSLDSDNDRCISLGDIRGIEEGHDLHELMKTIDLPPGFRLTHLHMMLDQDGNGELNQEEFIEGMTRLVYCNSFQNQCIMQLNQAKITHEVRQNRHELQEDVERILANFREAVQGTVTSLAPSGHEFELHFDGSTSPRAVPAGGKANAGPKKHLDDPTYPTALSARGKAKSELHLDGAPRPLAAAADSAAAAQRAHPEWEGPFPSFRGDDGRSSDGAPEVPRAAAGARPRGTTQRSDHRSAAKISESGRMRRSSEKEWKAVSPKAAAGGTATE